MRVARLRLLAVPCFLISFAAVASFTGTDGTLFRVETCGGGAMGGNYDSEQAAYDAFVADPSTFKDGIDTGIRCGVDGGRRVRICTKVSGCVDFALASSSFPIVSSFGSRCPAGSTASGSTCTCTPAFLQTNSTCNGGKNNGGGGPGKVCVGNPCNAGTGNKFEQTTLY